MASRRTRWRGLYQVPLVLLWLVAFYLPLLLFTLLTLGRFTAALLDRMGRVWGRVSLWLLSVRLRVEGDEKARGREPRIVVFNHSSMLDMFVMTSVLPPAPLPVAKAELARAPVLGWLWRALGVVFVDRADTDQAKEQVRRAAGRMLDERRTVVLAPEGTRSPTGELLPFKKGAFHLALATRAPIVPVVVHGAYRLQPKGALHVTPGTVLVRFLDPVSTREWSLEGLNAHVEQVRSLFVRELAAGTALSAPEAG